MSDLAAGFTIRPAAVDEGHIITAHRRAMFAAMGYTDAVQLEAMCAAFAKWITPKLASGEYRGWFVVTENGVIAAGAGIWLMNWPPGIHDVYDWRANVLNVYTHPGYQRRGLARALMRTILDWCRAHRIRTIILHASDAGRPLYESMGFTATNEMRLSLPGALDSDSRV